VDVEEGLYKSLQDEGVTIITISKRLALTDFHNAELQLYGIDCFYSHATPLSAAINLTSAAGTQSFLFGLRVSVYFMCGVCIHSAAERRMVEVGTTLSCSTCPAYSLYYEALLYGESTKCKANSSPRHGL
jgi:hypothetical protein